MKVAFIFSSPHSSVIFNGCVLGLLGGDVGEGLLELGDLGVELVDLGIALGAGIGLLLLDGGDLGVGVLTEASHHGLHDLELLVGGVALLGGALLGGELSLEPAGILVGLVGGLDARGAGGGGDGEGASDGAGDGDGDDTAHDGDDKADKAEWSKKG